jgi:hypothetical protein
MSQNIVYRKVPASGASSAGGSLAKDPDAQRKQDDQRRSSIKKIGDKIHARK